MRPNSLFRLTAGVLLALFAYGCSGNPEVALSNPPDSIVGGADGKGGSSSSIGSGGNTSIDIGDGGSSSAEGGEGNSGGNCKRVCEATECGPVSDGCDGFIECGGCKAPETCGGGGIPSHCGGGTPVDCTPKTCAEVGAECGMQADGCGGALDCWSDAAKASGTPHCEDPLADCVDGTCTVLTSCTKLTCADYATTTGLCGPVSDGCGGTLDCGFTCGTDEVCGANAAGKCGKVTCQPVTCEAALAGKPSRLLRLRRGRLRR
ncbi:MAG: hypothetical protein QM756_32645 [Polyangiaceae bacterium]